MDTYFDLSFLLNQPEGNYTSPNEHFDPNAPSIDPFDILVDTEHQSAAATNLCVIC